MATSYMAEENIMHQQQQKNLGKKLSQKAFRANQRKCAQKSLHPQKLLALTSMK